MGSRWRRRKRRKGRRRRAEWKGRKSMSRGYRVELKGDSWRTWKGDRGGGQGVDGKEEGRGTNGKGERRNEGGGV